VVGRQNADIADTLQLRYVAMTTTFWLSMGYNVSCVIASDTLFDSRDGFSGTSYPMKTSPRSTNFWDYISCKWALMEDKNTRVLYKGSFVFSHLLRLLVVVSGFVVAAIGTASGGRLPGWELTR